MIPAPFRFLEMEKELRTNATQLDEAKLGVASKALDPVDVVLAAGKLVFVVMNAPVFVTAQEQAVIAEPAVDIDGGLGKHLSLDDRLQLCPGAVLDHAGEDFAAAFEQSDDGRLAAGSASAPAPHAPWAKIGLVNLDFTGKEPGFLHRHLHYSAPQALIDPLAGLVVDPASLLDGQRRYVRTKYLSITP